MLRAVTEFELRVILRQRRMIVLQLGLAALFGLLVILRWPTDSRIALGGSRSRQIFEMFGYGLLATLLLILPVFPATSIVREKKRGTLALLLNTPLGAWRIFTGKLLTVLVLAAIILAMSLPAASACYAMGGLSLYQDLGRVYLLLLLVALQYGVLGLLVSSYSQTIDSAVRLAYGVVLGLSVFSLGPYYFLRGTTGRLHDLSAALRSLSPFAVMVSLSSGTELGSQGLLTKTDSLTQYALWSAAIVIAASIWAMSRLNHKIFDISRPAGQISDDLSSSGQMVRRLFFLVDPQKRSRGISWIMNPVMVKEFRCRRFGRLHWLLRLVAVCAVLSLGLTYATTAGTLDWGAETIGGIMVVMQVALIVLITPSLAAGLISVERESRGWQLLQTTPLSMFSIIVGKLLSVFFPLLLILCATLPGYLVMVYIEPGMELQVKRVVVCLALMAVFSMLFSAAIGSLFLRTAASTACAYGALLALCGFPLLIWAGRDAPFGHDTVQLALSINPIATALSVIRMPGFQYYELIPVNWWFLGIGSVVSLLVLLAQTYRISRPH